MSTTLGIVGQQIGNVHKEHRFRASWREDLRWVLGSLAGPSLQVVELAGSYVQSDCW